MVLKVTATGRPLALSARERKTMAEPNPEKLHIFVNNLKFDADQGVKSSMTGAEIAALVNIPAAQAVVRRETGPDQGEIPIDQPVTIHQADHFTATRKMVQGGCR